MIIVDSLIMVIGVKQNEYIDSEGRYHINPKEIQSYLQTSVFQKIASLLGMGAFPNGPIAWGFKRVWIYPNNVKVLDHVTNTYIVRSGFSIHGVSPGSAGCIDLSGDANRFFNDLKHSESTCIRLNVNYGYKKTK